MRVTFVLLFAWIALAPVVGGAEPREETQAVGGGGSVSFGSDEFGIQARATIRVHASRETVWAMLTSCAEALKIVPGLDVCEVRESAHDESWARIHQVMDYARFLPRMSYDVKASYSKPQRISFERIAGDAMTLRGSWMLQADGDYTVAHYAFDFAPSYWLPHWMLRAALKHDLPRMLRALRAKAEAAQSLNPG